MSEIHAAAPEAKVDRGGFGIFPDGDETMLMGGEYKHTMDQKGRVTVPARFRAELGDSFVVTRGLENCLSAYSAKRWQRIEENLKNISITNRTGMKLVRLILGNAIVCEVDQMGRILITKALREKVGLGKNVALIGCGDRFEIWDQESWDEFNAPDAFDTMTDEENASLEAFDL